MLSYLIRNPRGIPAVVALAGCTAAAYAQVPTPGFRLGTELSTAYDSNVSLLPAGPVTAGNQVAAGSQIDTARVLAEFDRGYDRENVIASADIGRVVYRALPTYDYTSQNLRLFLKSELPAQIEAQVEALHSVQLANQASLEQVANGKVVAGGRPNTITTDTEKGQISIPLFAYEWRGLLRANASRYRNSDAIDKPGNLDMIGADAGVRYITGKENFVDLLARVDHGRYPEGALTPALDTSYNDRWLDLQTQWRVSGSSIVRGHIGYEQRRNGHLGFLDFSGAIYDMTYNWTPTPKTYMSFLVLRSLGVPQYVGYQSATTHTYSQTTGYRPTEKISVEAHYKWSQINYAADVQSLASGLAATSSRVDEIQNYGLEASWTPYDWLTFRLTGSHERRGANVAGFDYTDHIGRLAVRALF